MPLIVILAIINSSYRWRLNMKIKQQLPLTVSYKIYYRASGPFNRVDWLVCLPGRIGKKDLLELLGSLCMIYSFLYIPPISPLSFSSNKHTQNLAIHSVLSSPQDPVSASTSTGFSLSQKPLRCLEATDLSQWPRAGLGYPFLRKASHRKASSKALSQRCKYLRFDYRTFLWGFRVPCG